MSSAAIIYARFSPRPLKKKKVDPDGIVIEKQEDGQTIENQIATCRQYCLFRGLTVVDAIADPHESARLTHLFDRPKGRELSIRDDFTHIVVTKLDRLFRNTEDGIRVTRSLHDRGIEVHLADQGGNTINVSTAIGRFIVRSLLSASELEVDLIGERTRTMMQHRSRSGQRMTHPDRVPFGWQPSEGGMMTPNPDERDIMEMVAAYSREGRKLREICRLMTEEGLFLRGKQWHPQTVKRVLAATVDTE